MKWPFRKDGAGNPVSPGSNSRVVGPSCPELPKGIINSEFTRSLAFRASSETISTQCRTGGLPRLALHISPRR